MNIVGLIKNSFIDYPQKIACVVFTPGCNMNCWYCHNREIITMQKGTIAPEVVFEFLKTRVGLIDAVVISGGEPTLQDQLVSFARKVKNLGFLVKLDTNGTNPEVIKQLVDNKIIDYVAMDIKAPLNNYKKITVVPDIEKVKQSIKYLLGNHIDYEFRTTFAPNLTVDDITQIVQEIAGARRYSLQAYIKPDYITNDKLVAHSPQVFHQLKKNCEGLVQEFLLKNL